MSNGPTPARPDGTVDDAQWLFPQERAPPPRDEGCKQNGFGDPAPHSSNGFPPTPSPPPLSPQMGHGGSPPAHLPSSYLSDPSWWLQFKWSQPPPRSPEWLFEYHNRYNPPANVGRPLRDESWLQRAIREDQQAAGLLPPAQPGGPICLGARARAEHAYRDWKAAIDDLWEDEHHRLCLIEEQAARARQEEDARRQKLLDAQAARARQEAAAHARQEATAARACQEEAACRQRAAEARKMAAAQLIFLWLRRRRLSARLACQTSRRQQREAAIARQHHEDECFTRALQAEKQRMQVAAAQAKALTDEANERHRQAEAAIGAQQRQVAAAREKQAADVRRAAESAALALVEERCCQEALLAAEAEVQRRHEEVLAEKADVHRRHKEVLAAEADEQRQKGEVLAAEADVQRRRRHKEVLAAEAADVQHRHEPAALDTALDAAPTMTPSAPPTAVLSFPPRPLTYVDAVLSTIGGEAPVPHLVVALPPQPSAAGGAFQTVRHRSRPRRRTGRRN
jgi:hypothetical protein